MVGCSEGGRPFAGSAKSLDDLGATVLSAFEEGNPEALARVRLAESEHNQVIWPELPAAQRGYPIDLAWQNIQLRNARSIPRAGRVLQEMRPLEFLSVQCEGETESFATFRVHTECHAHFRSRDREYRMQLFRHVAERHGGYKIFRYYDEDPELVPGTEPPGP